MRNSRRQLVKHNRKKKRLILMTVAILAAIYLTINIISGENGLLRYFKLKSTKEKLIAENRNIDRQNEDIKSQIENMKKDPELLEEFAREYGYSKEGELIFKFKE